MGRRFRRLVPTLVGAGLLLPGAVLAAGTMTAGASTPGVVTVRAWPSVVGLPLVLDGQVRQTDARGSASFTTGDLEGARDRVRLGSGHVSAVTVSAVTRARLISVVADPHHSNGSRLLVAKLALTHPVALRVVDRLGAQVPNAAVTGLSLRATDGQAQTAHLPADGSPLWLDQEVADRRPGAGLYATRFLSWNVSGVRVGKVSVAVGAVPPLDPSASAWQIPLAGYPFNVSISVVPPVENVQLKLGALTATTDAAGSATLYTTDLDAAASQLSLASPEAGPDRRVSLVRVTHDTDHARGTRSLALALDVQAAVRLRFVDLAGKPFDTSAIRSVTLGSLGQTVNLGAAQLRGPIWLPASRLTQSSPPKSRPVSYTIDDAQALGANGVFAGTQRFDPIVQPTWTVQMHLYRVQVQARDLVFGTKVGGAVALRAPDGSRHRARLHRGTALIGQVPRGEYDVTVSSGARHMSVPIRVARDQLVPVRVISWWDVLLVAVLGLGLAVLIVKAGSRARRRRDDRAAGPVTATASVGTKVGAAVLLIGLSASLVTALPPGTARAAAACPAPSISSSLPAATPTEAFPIPVWSYYYIWYNVTSWRRAKIDTPALGCYSSDDADVMRAHVRLAKAAGITGFLVSWKHNPALDNRLRTLTSIAASEHFSLGIVYQALDFARHPLPTSLVQSDLNWFAATYGKDPVFAGSGKPTVVWTGTEQYDAGVIESVAASVRPVLSIYSSAKSVADYLRVAGSVEGDAYYWSSADPTTSGFAAKLAAMGAAVHAHGGRWLAPAAPGFDGRPLGGRRTVARNEGAALRTSVNAAVESDADALGIISWNEWSENTYVEPSQKYGRTDLAALAEVLHGQVPPLTELDSSDDPVVNGGWRSWHSALVLVGLCLLAVAWVERRRRALRRTVNRALRDELPQLSAAITERRDGGQRGR